MFLILDNDIVASDIKTRLVYLLTEYGSLFTIEDLRYTETGCREAVLGHTFSTHGSPINPEFIYAQTMYELMTGTSKAAETSDDTDEAEETEESEDEAEENEAVCEVCNESFDQIELHDFNGSTECNDCLHNHTFACARCCDRTEDDDGITFDDETYCEDCIDSVSVSCDRCSDRVSNDDSYRTSNGDYVCQSCYEDHYFCCDSCNEVIHQDYYAGNGYCDSCHEESEDEDSEENSDLIHEYNYRPRPVFFGTGKLFSGIELEVNTKSISEHAETVSDLLEEHAYLKHDSSIGGGFEIVSHPHSLTEQRKAWTPFLDAIPSGLTSYKSGNCGMHVHMSKAGLTQMQIRKVLVFINAPENLGYVTTIAQRSGNTYCEIAKKDLTERLSSDRYEAVNTTNTKTIEFRIFRGTTRKDRFFKNLEFAYAVVEFCGSHNYSELTARNFIKFVTGRKSSYKYLHNYHIEKGLVNGKPLPVENKRQLELTTPVTVLDEAA